MNSGSANLGGDSPAEVYSHRLQELFTAQTAQQRREKLLGLSKLAVAACTLIAAVILLRHLAMIEFLLAPVCVFVVLAVLQEKLIRNCACAREPSSSMSADWQDWTIVGRNRRDR